MDLAKDTDLAGRFLLEAVALGDWGYRVGQGPLARIGLAVAAPLAVPVVWSTFVAPKAAMPVPDPVRLLHQGAVFGAVVAALAWLGHRLPAGVFGLVVVAIAP